MATRPYGGRDARATVPRAWFEQFLAALPDYERRPAGLPPARELTPARARALLEALGHPERAPRVVHLAGSKGKGATAWYLHALLAAAGVAVARYSSPHEQHWRERLAFSGVRDPDGARGRAADRLRAALDARPALGAGLTWFEALTVWALTAAREAGAEYALVECGLGGTRDATNVFARPALTVITTLALEHRAALGPTLHDIARQKAGIIRPGVPLLTGVSPESPVAPVLLAAARARGAPIAWRSVDFTDAPAAPGEYRLSAGRRRALTVRPANPGRHLAADQALALAAFERLATDDPRLAALDDRAIRAALDGLALPARCEVHEGPEGPLVLDAAHDPSSARALAEMLAERFPGRPAVVLVALNHDKDAAAILAALATRARALVLTTNPSPRAAPADALRAAAPPGVRADVAPEPAAALAVARAQARAEAGAPAPLVVCGSFAVVGAIRRLGGVARPGAAWEE